MPDVWVVSESPELRQDPSEQSQMMVLEKQSSMPHRVGVFHPITEKKEKNE